MNYKNIKIHIIIVSLLISGCTSNSIPAQIENRQNMVFTKYGVMEIVRVYPNDTLEDIAITKQVPIEILAQTNNLIYPYHLYNIRTLMIPQEKFHKTHNNETLNSIAINYQVDLMQLVDINNMLDIPINKTLPYGMILKIPNQINSNKYINNENLTPAYKSTRDYDVMELDEVQSNIDCNDIEIEQLNNCENNINISIENNSTFKTITPLNSNLFIWPLSGQVVRDNQDGIKIIAPLNTPVRAAGEGKVIYAENDKGEYGNLIIIKHANDYLSAYAHNNQLLVKKGEEVHKGQIIGKVGKSGKTSETQLFFSMRKGKTIINPETIE